MPSKQSGRCSNRRSPADVCVARIVSGGQTGADRAALDWAIANRVPHGGWCPKGRLAENGMIPRRYRLRQTPTAAYEQRTEWNVRDSNGTVVFSVDARLSGGSLKTREFARAHRKPCLHVTAARNTPRAAARRLLRFVERHRIRVLNIAGPRASLEPGIRVFVLAVLDLAFGGAKIAATDSAGRIWSPAR